MEWKKVNASLVEYLDEYLKGYKAVRSQMFGCPVYFVNGNMLAGVQADSLFLRLSEQDRQEAYATSDEIVPFEPVKGRVMKDYVVFPETLLNQREYMQGWLDRAYAHTASLPPKEPKIKKDKKGQPTG